MLRREALAEARVLARVEAVCGRWAIGTLVLGPVCGNSCGGTICLMYSLLLVLFVEGGRWQLPLKREFSQGF